MCVCCYHHWDIILRTGCSRPNESWWKILKDQFWHLVYSVNKNLDAQAWLTVGKEAWIRWHLLYCWVWVCLYIKVSGARNQGRSSEWSFGALEMITKECRNSLYFGGAVNRLTFSERILRKNGLSWGPRLWMFAGQISFLRGKEISYEQTCGKAPK